MKNDIKKVLMEKNLEQTSHVYITVAGPLKVSSTIEGIFLAEFVTSSTIVGRILSLSEKTALTFLLNGTPFQIKVWQAVMKIPSGQTTTYQKLAQTIGHPKAHRAVANALGSNKIAYFVPCHRVIRSDGSIGGYRWGIEKKIALLEAERSSL